MEAIFDEEMQRASVAVLLKHFSQIEDGREPIPSPSGAEVGVVC
jgi:hypothetical protein